MTDIQKQIGKRIRDLRKDRGLSQEQLAEMLDTHFSYIGACERGERNPTLSSLVKIAESLGVGVYELFTYVQEEASTEQATLFNEVSSILQSFDVQALSMAKNILHEIAKNRST